MKSKFPSFVIRNRRGYVLVTTMGLMTVIAVTAAASHQRSESGLLMAGAMKVYMVTDTRAVSAANECMARISGNTMLQQELLKLCRPNDQVAPGTAQASSTWPNPEGLPTATELGTTSFASSLSAPVPPNCIAGTVGHVRFPLKTGLSTLTPDNGGDRLSQCVVFRRMLGNRAVFVLRAYGMFGKENGTYKDIRSMVETTFDASFEVITDSKIASTDNSSTF